MNIILPAVRFVRCYDPRECRMRNIWMRVKTQDQLANEPMATELTVTAQTVEAAMFEIRKSNGVFRRFLTDEVIHEIERASFKLVDAKDSVYEVI